MSGNLGTSKYTFITRNSDIRTIILEARKEQQKKKTRAEKKPKKERKDKNYKREGEKKKKREEEEKKKGEGQEKKKEKREKEAKVKKGLQLELSDQVKILFVETNITPTLFRLPWWTWVGESRRRRWR